MIIERICFEQLYPTGIYANQRYRAEASVDDGEDLSWCYKKLQQEVEKAFVAMNPQIKWQEIKPEEPTIIQKETKETATSRMIQAIQDCTDMEVLKSFKLLAEKNPDFKEVYEEKLKELS